MCKHQKKKLASKKKIRRRFDQCGNLDICPYCASEIIEREENESNVHRGKSPKTPVLHKQNS